MHCPNPRLVDAFRTSFADTGSTCPRSPGGRTDVLRLISLNLHTSRARFRIYYDRKDSCFTHMRPEDIDWDYLLNTRHLHLTGLSVPLGPSTGEITENAVRRAKSRGVTTSIDVNYRSLLWTIEEARERLGPLIDGVDLLMCSSRDAKSVFGCEGSAESTARQMADVTGAATVVLTLGEEGVIAFDGSQLHREAAKTGEDH